MKMRPSVSTSTAGSSARCAVGLMKPPSVVTSSSSAALAAGVPVGAGLGVLAGVDVGCGVCVGATGVPDGREVAAGEGDGLDGVPHAATSAKKATRTAGDMRLPRDRTLTV